MHKFKKGDKVRRIAGRHNGMFVGDVDVVVEECAGGVTLDEFGCGHISSNLLKIDSGSNLLKKSAHNSWDYAEARRLQDAAKAAIEAYNEYVKRKPTDVFVEIYNPFQS